MNDKQKEAVIEVKDLVKQYADVTAVDHLSFEVYEGEIFGLLGPNGAGKTTTLSCIEGLVKANTGSIRVQGADPVSQPGRVKQEIGVQLQSTSLLPELSASEQIALFMELYGRKPQKDLVDALFAKVSLSEKADALPTSLSGGQQQRLALALALVNDPSIVILDEPTTGLDPQARYNTWQLIRELRDEGRTVIITTHYMEEAENLCDRIGIIDHGKMLALDTPAELVKSLDGLSRISTVTPLSVEEVAQLPGVHSAWQEQTRINVRCYDVPGVITKLHELASAQGMKVEGLTVHEPNLEELFLNLTGQRIRDDN
ncbi:MAG: ABC transporter ATP-binding protein [Chloroflexota bacterium]